MPLLGGGEAHGLVSLSDYQREHEDLADALHREAHVGVTDDVHLAVAGGDHHPELARVYRRQARDVRSHPAATHSRSQ